MGAVGYILLLLALILWGIFSGWRKGLLGQTGSLLGIAFGVVGSRVLLPDVMPTVAGWIRSAEAATDPEYMVASVATLIIVAVAYGVFLLCGVILNRLLKVLSFQPLDSVLGAIFGVAKWCFLLSVAYNAILGLQQDGPLLKLCSDGDGNPVEMIMGIAPAVVGYDSPDELMHLRQLEDARKISMAGGGQRTAVAKCYFQSGTVEEAAATSNDRTITDKYA